MRFCLISSEGEELCFLLISFQSIWTLLLQIVDDIATMFQFLLLFTMTKWVWQPKLYEVSKFGTVTGLRDNSWTTTYFVHWMNHSIWTLFYLGCVSMCVTCYLGWRYVWQMYLLQPWSKNNCSKRYFSWITWWLQSVYVEIVLVSYCFVLIYITRDCYVMSLLIRIETELILIKKKKDIKNVTTLIFSQPRY